ncbi:glycosyltransferase family 4 protein [Jiella marina]|uniref:glycosyltransferase family 4 protein n=1 Tax=Jiella sp. LLJ827 TaxID=2917712 RepID=UPI0021008F5E|nr:glycosyltransferase family 4 protein [Jiella sp. LLJ827]MCQ0990303.1 glycosyltransferase family 4 protein [Jiella sp. LLJ827]
MHLLFVTSLLPERDPTTGFEIANQAIIAAYRRQGVRLSFAGFRRPGSRPPGHDSVDLGEIVIENALASRKQKALWALRAMASGRTISAQKLALYSRAALMKRLAEAGPVDGYILNSVQMPGAYPFLSREMPSIFIAHNVEHRSALENAKNATDATSRLLYRREAALLKRVETRLCRQARVIHGLSAADLEGLGLAGDPRALPLALSIGRPASKHDAGERRHDVGLIGTWSWAPNRVGLDWFVNEVAPHLPNDITVAIAGRFDGGPPAAPANIRYVGRVPDAQAFVRASRVLALATRGGTGVQLKTIETFEEGMPAVATPAALRGIGRIPANVRTADDARGFANELAALVRAERAGANLRLDGSAFAMSQKLALDRAIQDGLRRFDRAHELHSRGAATASPQAGRLVSLSPERG